MKASTTTRLYWIVTIIFALANFASGISELFPNQQGLDIMTFLGYPAYLLIIIGIAKILGSIALVQTKYKTIKEWAYAGFAIDFVGASASFAFVGGGLSGVLMPLVFLAVMFVSYALWKRQQKQ